MISGYTFFMTYMLTPYSLTSHGYGNSNYIHCNYINKHILDTSNPYTQEMSVKFPIKSDFKFLSTDITKGTGYTANKIFAIIQLVPNSGFTSYDNVKPISSAWKLVDLTSQISGHILPNPLTADELTNTLFKIDLTYSNYTGYTNYVLGDYITYPTVLDNKLSFGDEEFFMGNVTTEIKATAYTTDILIQLGLNEFNSSTNNSWNSSVDDVYITEIGIYDSNKNLVGIGKFNNPIKKNSNISRTIVFDMDF